MSGYHALLLAAGAGSRFGGRKLLVPWRGEPLVRVTARLALAAPVDTCIAVTGCDGVQVEAALAGLAEDRLRVVRAANWSDGLSASLRRGIMALPATSRGIVVFLADMPLVPPTSAARLVEALDRGAVGAEFVRGGVPAHPVAYSRMLLSELATLRGDTGGRRVLATRSDVIRIETEDQGAVFDIDCIADLTDGE